MPGKRMKLTLGRAAVQKIADWSHWNIDEAMSERERDLYEAISFQCEKALKYDDERLPHKSVENEGKGNG